MYYTHNNCFKGPSFRWLILYSFPVQAHYRIIRPGFFRYDFSAFNFPLRYSFMGRRVRGKNILRSEPFRHEPCFSCLPCFPSSFCFWGSSLRLSFCQSSFGVRFVCPRVRPLLSCSFCSVSDAAVSFLFSFLSFPSHFFLISSFNPLSFFFSLSGRFFLFSTPLFYYILSLDYLI